MNITFDATKLVKLLSMMRTSLPGAQKIAADDLIGLGATENHLIAYGITTGFWVRITTPCTVKAPGSVIVNRSRFLTVLGALRDETTLVKIPSGKSIVLETKATKSSFTLVTVNNMMPRPEIPNPSVTSIAPGPLKDQIRLNSLNGELAGGGYSIKGTGQEISIMASDMQRFVVTKQHLPNSDIMNLLIHSKAMDGVGAILGVAQDWVNISKGHNLTKFDAQTADGDIVEFGFPNSVGAFPDMSKILNISDYPNRAQFEVPELLEAMTRASALADSALPFADFKFTSSEVCIIEAFSSDGKAEMQLDCPSEVTDEATAILRLQLVHLKSLLGKAKDCGSDVVRCSWGTKRPVKWTFEFEGEPRFEDIDMTFILPAMNREA